MVECLPRVSVIVPSRNGGRTIGKCIASLVALEYPDFEVIVINDGSTDATADIVNEYARRYRNVRLLTTVGVGPSAARNRGIAEATGAFFAFTDDDCVVSASWLKELLHGFVSDSGKTGGVGGDQLSPDDECDFGRRVNCFLKTVGFVADYVKPESGSGIIGTTHNPTCNVMYRREAFRVAGGFKEGLWPGEDVEFDRRLTLAGFVHRYNPAAIVRHYRPATVKQLFRMMYRYGEAQAYLVRHFGFFRKIHFEPLALWIYVMLLAASLRWLPLFAAFLLLPTVGALVFFLRSVRHMMEAAFCLYALFITVIAWNAGFVSGVLTKTGPEREA